MCTSVETLKCQATFGFLTIQWLSKLGNHDEPLPMKTEVDSLNLNPSKFQKGLETFLEFSNYEQ